LIVTIAVAPFSTFLTCTRVPKGRLRWAAVIEVRRYRSPLAVRRPSNPGPYQEAMPRSTDPEVRRPLGRSVGRVVEQAVVKRGRRSRARRGREERGVRWD
jgi:hypothetical protein